MKSNIKYQRWLAVCSLLSFMMLIGGRTLGAQQLLNLDFERLSVEGLARPWGWQVYAYSDNVVFEGDTVEVKSGDNSMRITGGDEIDEQYFALTFAVEPNQLLDKQVGLRFWAKTNAFSGEAGLQLEAVGEVGEGYGTLHEEEKAILASDTWQEYYLTGFDLGNQLHTLNVSIRFRGSGTVWIDKVELLLGNKVLSAVPVAEPFTREQEQWLVDHLVPFSTPEPLATIEGSAEDFVDLKEFRRIVGDAQIIALGEATHGTSEFFKVKHRLLQYAVQELGVRVFVLEDNQLLVEKVNEYVLEGKGEAESVIRSLFAVWNTEEMLALIKWLRAYNVAHPDGKIAFVGMDIQNPTLALEALDSFLLEKAPLLHVQVDSLLRDFSSEWRNSYFKSEAELYAWERATTNVYDLIRHQSEKWLSIAENKADSTAVVWAVQNARLLTQCVASILTGGMEGREQAMAENIDWILGQYPKETRILVWAHDTHVNRGEAVEPAHNYYLGQGMGAILARKYGDNYRSCGLFTYAGTCLGTISYQDFTRIPFTLYTSPAGSLEEGCHRVAEIQQQSNLILNLRAIKGKEVELAWLYQRRPVRYVGYVAEDYGFGGRYVIPQQFDGIIFIDRTTAAKPLVRD